MAFTINGNMGAMDAYNALAQTQSQTQSAQLPRFPEAYQFGCG